MEEPDTDHSRHERPIPPATARPRGRPVTRPELRAQFTFWRIDALRRTGLRLAQREAPLPPVELEALLQQERVPPGLHPAFRIVGRHLRYLNKRDGLSPEEAHELATLASDPMHGKPRETWPEEDLKKSDRMIELQHKLQGRSAARALGVKGGLGAPDAGVLSRVVAPAYLRGLWLALDQCGAAQHGASLQTFRRWRRKLQKSRDLREPTPRSQQARRAN